jgi:hypothetical protein
MFRLNGTVSAVVYKLDNGCHIVFFGDDHDDKSESCETCELPEGCMDVKDFLDSLKYPADVFVESAWYSREDKVEKARKRKKKAVGGNPNFLQDVIDHFAVKMYNPSKSMSKLFRVHHSNVRQGSKVLHLTVLSDIVIKLIEKTISDDDVKEFYSHFESLSKLTEYVDKFVKVDDDYKEAIVNMFANNSKAYLERGQRGGVAHRIRKQIQKLPEKTQTELLQFHDFQCKAIEKRFAKSFVRTKTHKTLLSVLLLYISHLMDMYLLARLLFYAKPDSTIAAYTGSSHTTAYTLFFDKFYSDPCTKLFAKPQNTPKVTRCLELPVDIAHQLLRPGIISSTGGSAFSIVNRGITSGIHYNNRQRRHRERFKQSFTNDEKDHMGSYLSHGFPRSSMASYKPPKYIENISINKPDLYVDDPGLIHWNNTQTRGGYGLALTSAPNQNRQPVERKYTKPKIGRVNTRIKRIEHGPAPGLAAYS